MDFHCRIAIFKRNTYVKKKKKTDFENSHCGVKELIKLLDLFLRAFNVRKIPAILNLAPESLYGEYVDGNDFTQKGVHMAEVSREKKKTDVIGYIVT